MGERIKPIVSLDSPVGLPEVLLTMNPRLYRCQYLRETHKRPTRYDNQHCDTVTGVDGRLTGRRPDVKACT